MAYQYDPRTGKMKIVEFGANYPVPTPAAVGGYGTPSSTTPGGVPTTGSPPVGTFDPEAGGYPFPINMFTGGVGYNLGPGGYGASTPTTGRADTPMGPSVQMQRKLPRLQRMPTTLSTPSYTRPQRGYGY